MTNKAGAIIGAIAEQRGGEEEEPTCQLARWHSGWRRVNALCSTSAQ